VLSVKEPCIFDAPGCARRAKTSGKMRWTL